MEVSEMIDISGRSSVAVLARRHPQQKRRRLQIRSARPVPRTHTTPSMRNMSVQRAAQDEMNGALRLASHELKSPLTTILGCLQLLESKVDRLISSPSDSPDVGKTITKFQELLALATREVEIEDRLATELIDACRIWTAQLTLRPRLCDLGHIVAEAVAGQRAVSPRRIIHLDLPDRELHRERAATLAGGPTHRRTGHAAPLLRTGVGT